MPDVLSGKFTKMLAVIKTGSKQYVVSENDEISVEKVDLEAGSKFDITDVLMLETDSGVKVGKPLLEGARVSAEVLNHGRDDKIIVFKKKRRQNYRRTQGHRQHYTVLKITDIVDA